MEQQGTTKTIHYYDRESQRILCGLVDPTAHWTIRSRVSCAVCSALLRERRQRPAGLKQGAATDA
jgi:hypothetical protein